MYFYTCRLNILSQLALLTEQARGEHPGGNRLFGVPYGGKLMTKFIRASIVLAILLLSCVYGAATFNVAAQPTESGPSAFEAGSEIHCFSIPEDQQDATCWVYNSGDHTIGFYHPDGQGPSAFWKVEDFQGMSSSDDGRMAIIVTSHTVEVSTLLRKTPGRLSGITTPRTMMKYVRNDVNFLAASVAEGKLQILIEGWDKPLVLPLTHEFKKRVFLPALISCEEGPNNSPAPIVATTEPRRP